MDASKLEAGESKSDCHYAVFKTDNSYSPSFIEISINTIDHSTKAHTPQYSKISEKIRSFSSSHQLAHSFQCSAFCGGLECKYENPVKWGVGEGVAFKGLYSHWITDSILAMARPSTSLFTEYNILKHFLESGINAVVNLQTAGEHAQCGPGLESSGFTYNPEILMKNNIFFYNYPWPDYGAPSLSAILDVVKVVDFSCNEGKVAIHCHAGLGRTGVVIACYLLYSQRLFPDEVITIVRQKRPDSIQTRGQLEVIQIFYNHLCSLWELYPVTAIELTNYLQNQSKLLHGEEEKKYRYIPKVMSSLCERIRDLSINRTFTYHCRELHTSSDQSSKDGSINILKEESIDYLKETNGCSMISCHSNNHLLESMSLSCDCCHSDIVTTAVRNIKCQINTSWKWSLLHEECDPTVLFILLYNFFDNTQPFISHNPKTITDFWENLKKHQSTILTLVLDTIKTIINEFNLSDNIQPITDHLVLVLFNTCQQLDSTQYISPKQILIQYLTT